MKPKTFKNAEEFTRYIEGLTGKPFKAMASTEGTTVHEYLSGQRDYTNLFTDSDSRTPMQFPYLMAHASTLQAERLGSI